MNTYRWNAAARRYIDSQGRFVPTAIVQASLEAALTVERAKATALAEQLVKGEVTLAQWEVSMREVIKTTQLWSAALANGGWEQMTAADFGRVGQVVRVQFGWLERLARQVSAGLPLDGSFYNRVRMYMNAARATYQAFRRAGSDDDGFTSERNVLGAAEHCLGCLAATAQGWVPIGTLVPIGSRDCRNGCQCEYEFS